MTAPGHLFFTTRGRWNFKYGEIEVAILAMNEHESKIWLCRLKGAQKLYKIKQKKFWIRPFFDPPGPLELFSELFWASKKGEGPHRDFVAGSHNCHRRPATEARKARSAGLARIFLKTESTKIGHFFQWKIHRFEGIFQDMRASWHSSVVVLKLQMTTKLNFLLLPFSAGSSPQNKVF